MNPLRFLLNFIPQSIAYAHCDIPCGIYDPHHAQLAAHTVIRMTQFLGEVKRDDETKAEHAISRVTRVKEIHSDIIEDELTTLRNDYFKDAHFEEYPKLSELFTKALKASEKARQEINMPSAEESLSAIQEIAEIFYKTKGLTPIRVKSAYPTEREIVLHK